MKETTRRELRTEPPGRGTPLDPEALATWLRELPTDLHEVRLAPIMEDRGDQRDPVPLMVGMLATWEEER